MCIPTHVSSGLEEESSDIHAPATTSRETSVEEEGSKRKKKSDREERAKRVSQAGSTAEAALIPWTLKLRERSAWKRWKISVSASRR